MSDVRCPVNESRLFLQVHDGVLEVACRDCRQVARRTNPDVVLVLHRYTLAGEFVDSQELALQRRV